MAKAARQRRATEIERAKKQQAFLAAYANLGNVRRACEETGISRSTVSEWRQSPEFEALFQLAIEDAVDTLEAEARRRALEGWEEEVYQMGAYVGTVRRYSDNLMALLLRGLRPSVYRDRIEATVDGKLQHGRLIDPTKSTDAELAARIAEAQTALGLMAQFSGGALGLPKAVEGQVVEPARGGSAE